VTAQGWTRPFRTRHARSPPAWVATLDLPAPTFALVAEFLRSVANPSELSPIREQAESLRVDGGVTLIGPFAEGRRVVAASVGPGRQQQQR
jgi:hypothetical protein